MFARYSGKSHPLGNMRRSYSLNSRTNTTIRFRPTNPGFHRKLDPIESYYSNMYLGNSFIFRSNINVPKVIESFDRTLQKFDFSFSTVSYSGNDKVISHSQDSETTLEIEYKDETLQSFLT